MSVKLDKLALKEHFFVNLDWLTEIHSNGYMVTCWSSRPLMGITVNTAVCVAGPGDNTALDPGTVKSPYPQAIL